MHYIVHFTPHSLPLSPSLQILQHNSPTTNSIKSPLKPLSYATTPLITHSRGNDLLFPRTATPNPFLPLESPKWLPVMLILWLLLLNCIQVVLKQFAFNSFSYSPAVLGLHSIAPVRTVVSHWALFPVVYWQGCDTEDQGERMSFIEHHCDH